MKDDCVIPCKTKAKTALTGIIDFADPKENSVSGFAGRLGSFARLVEASKGQSVNKPPVGSKLAAETAVTGEVDDRRTKAQSLLPV